MSFVGQVEHSHLIHTFQHSSALASCRCSICSKLTHFLMRKLAIVRVSVSLLASCLCMWVLSSHYYLMEY